MAGEWFCKIAGRERGPLSPAQLKLLALHGELRPTDPVRQGLEGPWVPAGRVKGLFSGSAPKQSSAGATPLAAEQPVASEPEPPPIQVAFGGLPAVQARSDKDQSTRPIQVSPAVRAMAKQAEAGDVCAGMHRIMFHDFRRITIQSRHALRRRRNPLRKQLRP